MNGSIRSQPVGLMTFRVLMFVVLAFCAREAFAKIDLSVLQNDGYGMAEIKRPDPNTLTVIAEINGHKMRLILDTGLQPGGILLHNDRISSLGTQTRDIKGELHSASGQQMSGFKGGQAERVRIGNVELAQVPIFFGNVKPLRSGDAMRRHGADGFLGAGFMKTTSAIVDLQNLRFYLRPPGKGRRAVIGPGLRGAGLAEAAMSGSANVDVEINGGAGKMEIDTGAFHALIDTRFGEKIKAAMRGSNVGAQDAAGKISRTKLMQVRSFKIGGTPVRVPDLRLSTLGFYSPSGRVGLLGMDILGPNGAIIDFGSGKLYFYPSPK
jgi:hypothetical protein